MDLSFRRVVLVAAVAIVLAALFVPTVRNGLSRALTTLGSSSETITVPSGPNGLEALAEPEERQEFELVTLLGFEGIPAILDPEFVTAEEARDQLRPEEPVLGLSINGDARAYSIPMLSAHEIVNDEVGGVPVAITW